MFKTTSNTNIFIIPKRKSGNFERQDRPGTPQGNGKHQKGHVPWEGMTANKKSVWSISTKPFSEAHFATFVAELIIDPIKAGTSEHGQCSKCGKPYVRIAKKELKPTDKASPGTVADDRDQSADENDQSSNRVKSGQMPGFYNEYKTTGWKASCTCEGAEIIPDVVLDPFMGAGTTALVAKKLNRNFVGIEINPKYVKEISVPRLHKSLGMFYTPKVIEV